MGSIQKLYATTTGDAAAAVDVPQSGHIVGVYWSADGPLSADGDILAAELSFGSTNAFAANDTRQVISEIRGQTQLVTSGQIFISWNQYHPVPDVPVGAGERLFLHLSTGLTVRVACFVYYDFDEGRPGVRRR